MKETLVCDSCGKNWKRERLRGRKPKLCPKCLTISLSSSQKSSPSKPHKISPKDNPPLRQQQDDQQPVDISLEKVWSILVPRPQNWKQLVEQTANGSTWRCPKCQCTIEFPLPLADVPTHKCTPASKSQRLERIS